MRFAGIAGAVAAPPGGGMAPGNAAYVEHPAQRIMLFRDGRRAYLPGVQPGGFGPSSPFQAKPAPRRPRQAAALDGALDKAAISSDLTASARSFGTWQVPAASWPPPP